MIPRKMKDFKISKEKLVNERLANAAIECFCKSAEGAFEAFGG